MAGSDRQSFETSPPTRFILIDPLLTALGANQSVGFDPPLRAISFGVDGAIRCDTIGGNHAETIPAAHLAVGIQHACNITRMHKTGTTAIKLIGWY